MVNLVAKAYGFCYQINLLDLNLVLLKLLLCLPQSNAGISTLRPFSQCKPKGLVTG